ncbi:N-acetylglucosamine-6-phosphate deacetylase [Natronosporangium hydrolyticum]|uniref:N-acetylglucosamine-6-phosphate deacetylase n=1 Tax=Natronosporangium hydrolyticum TaxID=2811111 RepID=A0A895Y9D7_9ACTN|nr:N-acetylglucosamine-6-phosphate deacetylase [Natronosporangium hydrolyticum]QSB14374.1 N-acetylglucosamine-6-phosphate deacetylase [Natronosporangium hydrolyticum]
MTTEVRINGRVVTPDGIIDGHVAIAGDRIVEVAAGDPGDGHWLLPGFVDIHNHGGGGHSFATGDPDSARRAAEFHLRHGTTTVLASLVSSPYELMREAVTAYAPLVADGVLAGIHFEGPYLSAARCGAQNPQYLRDPSIEELTELVALGGGAVRMVTIAPERAGALAAIEWLVEQGVVAAVGHTDATYEQTRTAIAAGARVATHLFNGMPPVHHREPGPVLALLGMPRVVVELIADGVHLHDGTLRFAAAAAGPGGAALITDAIDATGMADGAYELGGQAVTVTGGVARLTTDDGSPGAIAGSTLTMAAALRRAVRVGVPMVDAVRMAATTPAAAIGLGAQVGALAPGRRADLVELDADLAVRRVLRAGTWLATS